MARLHSVRHGQLTPLAWGLVVHRSDTAKCSAWKPVLHWTNTMTLRHISLLVDASVAGKMVERLSWSSSSGTCMRIVLQANKHSSTCTVECVVSGLLLRKFANVRHIYRFLRRATARVRCDWCLRQEEVGHGRDPKWARDAESSMNVDHGPRNELSVMACRTVGQENMDVSTVQFCMV